MSLQTALDSIYKHGMNLQGFDGIIIDLFGGEPFLEFSLIQDICKWLKSQEFNYPHKISINTNGTLVHGKIQDWLIKNKNIYVGLSLDGRPETHNANRCNSFDLIDTEFFIKHYPNSPVRATINRDTIASLSSDIIYMQELGFKVTASLALGIDWGGDDIISILQRELKILSDYYLSTPHMEPCSIFKPNLSSIYFKRETKWCGTHSHMVSIDTEGNDYPCQSFQPNSAGANENYKNIDFNSIERWSDPECDNCIIDNLCPTCYGLNFNQSGSMLKRDKSICNIRKSLALANSYFIAKKIECGSLSLSPMDTVLTIRAIKEIQREFKNL